MVSAPPVLVNTSPDVVVRNEGDDVDLFCEASATPPATLTWLKDGRKLADTSGHVTVAGSHVTLRGVERSDAGVYSCTFKNVAGAVSHLIKLVVHGSTHPTAQHRIYTDLITVSTTECAVRDWSKPRRTGSLYPVRRGRDQSHSVEMLR